MLGIGSRQEEIQLVVFTRLEANEQNEIMTSRHHDGGR
jgi:hypothetical protein